MKPVSLMRSILPVLAALILFSPGISAQDLPIGLNGKAVDPFAGSGPLTVLIFVRTDCPLSNRYAPEIEHQANKFGSHGVKFWLVYPDPSETAASIRQHLAAYGYTLPAVRDPRHILVRKAEVDITPEAAVFSKGKLIYRGRIDNRVKDFGQTRLAATAHDLEEAISAGLASRPVAHPITQAVGCYISDLR